MTTLALTFLLWAAPGAPQPDAQLLVEVRQLLREQDFASVLEVLDAAGPDGDHPTLLRLRAEAYVGLLDYPAAVVALEGARPDAENLALRIRLLAMLSRDDEAREELARLLALDEPAPEGARLELAAELRDSGLGPEARQLLGSRAPGESAAMTLERGRLLAAEGDYDGAGPLLEFAASAKAAPAGAAFEFGRFLSLLGRREEAVTWLRRAAAESPGDPAVRFRLGQLLVQDPDPALAAEGRRLLSGYEESRLRARRRDLLLAKLNEHTVVGGSRTDRVPAFVTGSRDGWVELVGLLLDRGDPIEATRVIRAASVRYPGDPAFEIGRARAHLQLGEPVAAAAVLSPLVPAPGEPLGGASLSAARWLAEVRLREGDPLAAAALFDRVLLAGGEGISPLIRATAATAFAMSGDPARALRLFEQVLDRTWGTARAAPLSDSALVLDMLGRSAEAEARYRAALAADPTRLAAAVGLADLLLREGRPGEAVPVLRNALLHFPEDATLKQLLVRATGAGHQGASRG